jgi:hypothetical protein
MRGISKYVKLCTEWMCQAMRQQEQLLNVNKVNLHPPKSFW